MENNDDIYNEVADINYATELWNEAKKMEKVHQSRRLLIEKAIVEVHGHGLMAGTNNFDSGLKIVCSNRFVVDQNLAHVAHHTLGDTSPFTLKYSISKTQHDAMGANVAGIAEDAITIEGGKPSFSFKEKK